MEGCCSGAYDPVLRLSSPSDADRPLTAALIVRTYCYTYAGAARFPVRSQGMF